MKKDEENEGTGGKEEDEVERGYPHGGCRGRSNVISPNHSRGVSLVCYVLYVCTVGGTDTARL
ncbi:hypothetical protein WN48_10636 [Eufriesea mexicana]|uniref:Uncharacterized protein n=1 Tax=Eufriesea mexicana TaxID=516756 RepID=A0A310S6E4_9HYME|nr:hypothetical protein WN48_10636 [Eufriesea mexicana]